MGDNADMTTDSTNTNNEAYIEDLQDELAGVDPADAPAIAEEIARTLGDDLDETPLALEEAASDET